MNSVSQRMFWRLCVLATIYTRSNSNGTYYELHHFATSLANKVIDSENKLVFNDEKQKNNIT